MSFLHLKKTCHSMKFKSIITANASLLLMALSVNGHSSLVAAQGQQGDGVVSGNFMNHGLSYTVYPQVPSLHCRNGSTCQMGISTIHEQHLHLNLQTHNFGYHCNCLPIYTGHKCQVEHPSNPTGTLRSCYHSSKHHTLLSVLLSGGSSEQGQYCNCKSLNQILGPTVQKFAGIMCQHVSTSLCATSLVIASSFLSGGSGSHLPNGQFCTNHGTCIRMVLGEEPHL
jgi:hypothetical protein